MIRYIKEIALGIFLGIFLIVLVSVCSDYVEKKEADNYLNIGEVYEFNDTEFLVMKDMTLCGVKYQMGSIIKKDAYNRCVNN